MPDYRSMFNKEFLGHWDLEGREVTVTIEKVEARELHNGKAANKRPVLFFVGKSKGMICNKTNSKTVAGMYGNKTEEWINKKVTLYVTTTSMAGETVECIRIRNIKPVDQKGLKYEST